ncbi:unnamed protein product [Clonostachys byssicola]|uniref:Uncharacterized protein n=1 Tax=Clonostachys byssicola TaxID=160290 RepID=A0A9N9XXP6_9HYPO|nr:unnamed protein product [Clonostachys byssicola]
MLGSKMKQVRFQSTLESVAEHPFDPLMSHQTHTEPIPHYWSPREDDPYTITKSRTSTFHLVGNGAYTDTKGERFSKVVLWNSYQADEISCFALPQQDSETMAAQIYSKNDLLRMRQAPAEVELQKNLRNKLKGKVDLSRGHRKLGRIPEEPREVPVERALALAPTSVRQLDGTDSEWKYRGRSDSEDAQPQPISAPTGIAAQRDEGFQRFYRAVVSPTHVRVTAGGRIVPNNRATFSPNPKWAKDKPMSDNAPSHRVAVQGQTEPSSFQFPHVMPQMYPGFAPGPGVGPVPPPYTFIPWNMGMGGVGMSMGANFGMPIAPTPVVGANPALKKHRDATSSEQQSESGTIEKEASAASPLDFYDHTRSLLLNNQWMIPPTAPFYPVPLAPSHGFNGMAIPAPSAAPGGGNRDMANAKKSDQSMENKGPHHPSFSRMATAGTASQPNSSNLPISSIRPSEITRRHLDILRARLRYLEDQLQFNKHQIDERAVENDAQLARQFIQQFETNFEMQYNLEESFYPKSKEMEAQRSYDATTPKPSENLNHQNLATANNCRPGSDYSEFCQNALSGEAKLHHGSQTASDSSLYRQALGGNLKRQKSETRFGSGINSTKSVSAFAGSQPLTGSLRSSRSGTEKSRLPLDAALAPPFQPRSETMLQTYDNTFANSAGGFVKPGSGVEAVNNPVASLSGEKVSWEALSTPYVPQEDRVPYLVGHLPNGIGMDRAQVTDFTYERELTEDELRARHMYWGKAPHDLQKGLPKFNGKDFFPPSPVKDHSADSTITRKVPTQAGKKAMSTLQEQTLASDPFKLLGQSGHLFSRDGPGNSTQSETLPGPEHNLLRAAVAGAHHDYGGPLKRGGNSLDELAAKNPFRLAKLPVVDPKESSSSDEYDEDRELLFKGRKAMQQAKYASTSLQSRSAIVLTMDNRTHNRIWSSMLNKGNSSAGAVPGAVSTTTAQGVLPQYSGHATASLTPTISNNKASSRTNLAKSNDAYPVKTNEVLQGHQSENRPPGFNNAGGKR